MTDLATSISIPWGPLGYVTYKTAYARPLDDSDPHGPTEEWYQTVERVLRGARMAGVKFTPDEEDRLRSYMMRLAATPAGRGLWALGSQLQEKLGADGAVNCWFVPLESPEDYNWLACRLMAGGGVGYSVEFEYANKWPKVRGAKVEHVASPAAADYIVPDSREGWGECIQLAMEAVLHGRDFFYSTCDIRPHGAPLKTFGGIASGPAPLIEGIQDIVKIMNAREGQSIRPSDLSDMANIVGRLVVAGSKRRSAQLALGSPDDNEYLTLKRWSNEIPGWRSQANFSVQANRYEDLSDEFWHPYLYNDGENFGIVNIDACRTQGRTGEALVRPDHVLGVNPCGEAVLPKYGSCNLATLHLPNLTTYDEFIDAAKLLYRIQKAVAWLPHPHKPTQQVMAQDSRLGLSITGYLQAEESQRRWLSSAYLELRAYDRDYSMRHGYPQSIRLTTVKPEGTVSLLSGVTSGIHAAYDRYIIRRIRLLETSPLLPSLRNAGVPVVQDVNFDGSPKAGHVVAEFVAQVPESTTLAWQQTAVDQLEVAARVQKEWSDQSVSVTVTYKDGEIPAIREWLSDNWNRIKTVSFNRYSEHGFKLAPLEPISKEEYERRVSAIHGIDLGTDLTTVDDLMNCEGGACPIR